MVTTGLHNDKKLGYKAVLRKVAGSGDDFELKKSVSPYKVDFMDETNALRPVICYNQTTKEQGQYNCAYSRS